MKPRIVVVGSSNTDLVVKSPALPGPGETVIGGDLITAAGGKGANQAVAAARCGGEVWFIAKIGNDHFGKQALAGFKREKIKTDFIYVDKSAPSGVALIMVDDQGQNAISVAPGANGRLTNADVKKAKNVIKSSQVLLVQLEIPIETAIESINLASYYNVKIILNPAPARPLPKELFSKLSIITPNETEAKILTGIKIVDDKSVCEAAQVLRQKGVQTVIITLGEKGAFFYDGKNSMFIAP
ncbi:MAG: ribokinase, partial [Verrucomicrobiia bacterium]